MKTLSRRELREMKHFDAIANQYDVTYHYDKPFTKYKANKKAKEFTNIIKSVFTERNPKILEVGCGTGEYTYRVAQKLSKAKIIGLDISKNVILLAKKRCARYKNVEFVNESVYKTNFRKNTFDAVFGFYILHHLDITSFRKELYKILKKEGVAFFYEPNILNPIVYLVKSNKYLKKMVSDTSDEWAINPLKIRGIFKGFDVVRLKTTEFYPPFLFLPDRLKIFLDKIFSFVFGKIPIINLMGGSVLICLRKK